MYSPQVKFQLSEGVTQNYSERLTCRPAFEDRETDFVPDAFPLPRPDISHCSGNETTKNDYACKMPENSGN